MSSFSVAMSGRLAVAALALWGLVGCATPSPVTENGVASQPAETGTRAVATRAATPTVGPRTDVLTVDTITIEGGAEGTARQMWASALPAAVRRAKLIWGDDLRGPVSLVIPKDAAEYMLFADGDSEGIALTKFEAPQDPGGPEHVRIVVAPNEVMVREARVGVLAHELAHVAQRSYGTAGTGTWTLEGAAMWTQNLGSPPQRHPETKLLRQRAREGRLPTRLPADGAFTGGEESRLAYQQAWTTYLFLLQRGGREPLLALTQDVARGQSATASLQRHFGLDESTLVREWSSWVTSWT